MNPVILDSDSSFPYTLNAEKSGVQVFPVKRQTTSSVTVASSDDQWVFLLVLGGKCLFRPLRSGSEYDRGLIVIPADTPDCEILLGAGFSGYMLSIPASMITDKWSSRRYASLSVREAAMLQTYFLLIRNVLESHSSPYSDREMMCLCRAFLVSCRQYFGTRVQAGSHTSTAKIAGKFLDMVDEYGHKERELDFYADKLNITPKYLSAVITAATGRKASNLINERTIDQAKDLLVNTRMSVTDVAKEMNFKTLSDFCRYFKNSTGMQPNSFREGGCKTRHHMASAMMGVTHDVQLNNNLNN